MTVDYTHWWLTYCANDHPEPACANAAPPENGYMVTTRKHSMASAVQAVTLICLVIVYIATAIRIFTRVHLLKTFTYEDALMSVAAIGTAILVILLIASTNYGLGWHLEDVPSTRSWKAIRLIYFVQIVYAASICAAKIAVLLQIKRLFTGSKKGLGYWTTWTLIGLVTCAYTAVLFIWIFPCDPIPKFWMPDLVEGKCNHERGRLSGTVNILSDVAILVLPIAAVMKLHMCMRKKLGVCAVFTVGIIACIASVVRLYYTFDALNAPTDSTYWFSIIAMCATAELTAVILCGCSPMFLLFFQHMMSRRNRWEAHELGSTTTIRSKTEGETKRSSNDSHDIMTNYEQSV